MTHTEAWIVTLIGMSVVFFGLLLCVFFIQAFNRLARRLERGPVPHGGPPATAVASPAAPAEPVPGDVLAVIATVLEVERKLYSSRPDAGLLRRPATQP